MSWGSEAPPRLTTQWGNVHAVHGPREQDQWVAFALVQLLMEVPHGAGLRGNVTWDLVREAGLVRH